MKNWFKYGDATEKIHRISMSKVVVLIVFYYVTNYPKILVTLTMTNFCYLTNSSSQESFVG